MRLTFHGEVRGRDGLGGGNSGETQQDLAVLGWEEIEAPRRTPGIWVQATEIAAALNFYSGRRKGGRGGRSLRGKTDSQLPSK